jgi:hypothetical protein
MELWSYISWFAADENDPPKTLFWSLSSTEPAVLVFQRLARVYYPGVDSQPARALFPIRRGLYLNGLKELSMDPTVMIYDRSCTGRNDEKT